MLPLNTLAEQVLCLTFINPMRQRHFTSGGGLHRFDFWSNPRSRCIRRRRDHVIGIEISSHRPTQPGGCNSRA